MECNAFKMDSYKKIVNNSWHKYIKKSQKRNNTFLAYYSLKLVSIIIVKTNFIKYTISVDGC